MIRHCARERVAILHGVEPIHLRVIFDSAAQTEFALRCQCRFTAQKIGVERKNYIRFLQLRNRDDALAKRSLNLSRERLVYGPERFRKSFLDLPAQALARW